MSSRWDGETNFQPRSQENQSARGGSQIGSMRHPILREEIFSSDLYPTATSDDSPDGANNNHSGMDSGFTSGDATSNDADAIWSKTEISGGSALASLFRQMSQAGVNLQGSRESVGVTSAPSTSAAQNGCERNCDGGFSDEDDQESHTSSLESLEAPGAEERSTANGWRGKSPPDTSERDDVSLGCTTSCSSDSFELTSPPPSSAATGETVEKRCGGEGPVGSVSHKEIRPATTRQNPFLVEEEVSLTDLDTKMPTFDFERLEKQLQTAIEERESKDKLLMSDQVRKEMKIFGDDTRPYPVAAATRPQRSNLGSRLKTGRDLQICFMNDSAEQEKSASGIGSSRSVSKSKSTPMLGDDCDDLVDHVENDRSVVVRTTPTFHSASRNSAPLGRSVSSCSDSSLRASELRKAAQKLEDVEMSENPVARQQRLEREARVMLGKAKLAAHMQMEVEKQNLNSNDLKHRHSLVDELVGFAVGRKRVTRPQLTRMNITQLQLVVNEAHGKIKALNEELVQLLIERDSLHMEQDSMLVDIEDLLQHRKCAPVQLPEFLVLTSSSAATSNKVRIFKK